LKKGLQSPLPPEAGTTTDPRWPPASPGDPEPPEPQDPRSLQIPANPTPIKNSWLRHWIELSSSVTSGL